MILDKTGTITYGNRLAADFFPVGGACREEFSENRRNFVINQIKIFKKPASL